MKLILLGSAMMFCAAGGAFFAWMTSGSTGQLRRNAPSRSRLAELITAQTNDELRRHSE